MTRKQSHKEQVEQSFFHISDESAAIVIEALTETAQTEISDDPILVLLVVIKELGFETIDNLHKLETLYIIAGKGLEQTL